MREFDICESKHHANPNSFLANLAIAGRKHSLRERIYLYLRDHGPFTCEELSNRLQIRYTTCSARLAELKAERWITPSGIERDTTAGHPATAMRYVSEPEREALLHPKRGYEMAQKELFI